MDRFTLETERLFVCVKYKKYKVIFCSVQKMLNSATSPKHASVAMHYSCKIKVRKIFIIGTYVTTFQVPHSHANDVHFASP